jgi:acyl-CoA thioester hydrolase
MQRPSGEQWAAMSELNQDTSGNGPAVSFTSKQRVHWDMLDLLGVLHNAAYLLLFERARTDFWQAHGSGYDPETLDWPYLVVRNEINYRAPIRSDQEVSVTVAVAKLGNSSITFAHEVFAAGGELAADGQTVIVRIDAETHRPTPWSDRFRFLVGPHIRPT